MQNVNAEDDAAAIKYFVNTFNDVNACYACIEPLGEGGDPSPSVGGSKAPLRLVYAGGSSTVSGSSSGSSLGGGPASSCCTRFTVRKLGCTALLPVRPVDASLGVSERAAMRKLADEGHSDMGRTDGALLVEGSERGYGSGR